MYTNFDELPLYLSVAHIKDILHIGKVQAYDLVNDDAFPSMRVGGSIRVSKEVFREWTRVQSQWALQEQKPTLFQAETATGGADTVQAEY